MKTNVLLGSNFGAKLVVRLLDVEARSITLNILASGPPSSLYSKARTLLAILGEPVVIVIDAGTTEPPTITNRRQSIEEVMGTTIEAAPFRLLMALPSLEALLFTRPNLIAQAFGDGADGDGRVLELGRLSPKDAYLRLDPDGFEGAAFIKLFQALDDEDVAALRRESPIRELIAFVTEVGSPAAAVPSVP